VRQRLADYINADVDDVVLIENASAGVNGVLRSWPWRAGDKVLYFSTAYGERITCTRSGIYGRHELTKGCKRHPDVYYPSSGTRRWG
jgi:hypothetical protein